MSQKNKKMVIFDFDGTLCDSYSVFLETMNQLACTYRFRAVPASETESLREKSGRDTLKHVGIQWWKLHFVVRAARKKMGLRGKELVAFDGVRPMIADLNRAGFLCGILTSNARPLVQSFIKAEEIEMSFVVTGSGIFGKAKWLKYICRRQGAELNSQVFYVGDEVRDIEAAQSADIKSIAVSWGYNVAPILRKSRPWGLIHEPAELLPLLLDHFENK